MSDYQMFEAIVRDVEQITAQVKRFTLVSPTGAPLPGFSGGSHIIVQMQDGVLSRLPKAARVLCTSRCARAIP